MEGTIYLLLDCKCLTELHSDCGDCSFCLKKNPYFKMTYNIKIARLDKCGCPPKKRSSKR